MGVFIQTIGSGISGLVVGSFTFIGQTLHGMIDTLNRMVPGGLLAAVVVVFLIIAAWKLSTR